MMKRILFLICTSIIFLSCNKDDNIAYTGNLKVNIDILPVSIGIFDIASVNSLTSNNHNQSDFNFEKALMVNRNVIGETSFYDLNPGNYVVYYEYEENNQWGFKYIELSIEETKSLVKNDFNRYGN